MFESLQPLLPLFLLILVIVILAVVSRQITDLILRKQSSNRFPYSKKESVMTPSEQKYFRKLEQQYGQTHYIFCQVALDRIISTTDQKHFYTYWNKINKKSIDFVLVDKQSLQTVQLIELNDYTHHQTKRTLRDDFLKKVCDSSGIKLQTIY